MLMLKQDMLLISFAEFAITEYRYDPAGRIVAERDGRLVGDTWHLFAYNRGRRCTAYNYDGTIASRTYSYKESYLPDMEEVYVYDSCGRLTSTTIRVDKAVSVPVLNPAAGQDAADSEATDTASPAASSRWATAVIRREYDAIGRLARLRHGDAAVTEYSYDVHSWPVLQQTTYGTAANTSSIGYTLEYAPCYNGNIAKRTWAEGDYTYSYDALNRLESAVFTPAEGLADRPGIERGRIPDFSVYYCYDLRGNMTNVVRYGVVDAVSDFDRVETFGTLDELACSYDGNRLSNVTAITDALPFDGVTGLHADGEFELAYNDAGDMVSDASRGLLYTQWNADGHPMQYDIEGGHRQLLGWDAFGNHLYTSYETSVAPVSAGMRPGRTRRTSVRAYSGDGHVLRGGAGNSVADTLEMLHFAGGYFDADLVPHYYVTDYLGSNIAVIRADGTLAQSATYYPYGEPHRDPAASTGFGISDPALPMSAPTSNTATASTSSNPYLYGDKEYVRRDGLNEYIYGARMFVPSETRFNSMDKLCEKHPDQSPYLFCGGNPIRYGDDSGNDYHVKVNHEEQTITISADYYVYKSDVGSVNAAIGFWNDLSGQYAMDGYTINFALSYHEVDPYIAPNGEELEQRKSITYAMKEDNVGNLYMSVPNIPNDKENTVSAGSYSNRLIKISEADGLELTGPHEVGHSLGLLHSAIAGLMYPFGNSPERTKDVSISEIKAMIENAITGIVPKDENETEVGKGHLDNEEEIKKIEWKYEVTKAQ